MQYKITNGKFYYGSEIVFEKINFEIKDNEKIALIGRNGCGKTTLLKIINGELELATPKEHEKSPLVVSGNPNIGFTKQITFENEDLTFETEIMKVYKNVIDLENKLNNIQKQLENEHSDKLVEEYAKLNEKFEMLDGYFYKKEYNATVKAFGFTEKDTKKRLSEFSGGQKTKIAFIKLLLSKPDILLLDEPTNHLDINAIEWLENYLANYKKSVVIFIL